MATCVWCGWLHPHCHHLHPFFPPVPAIVWCHHHCRRGSGCCASVTWCCVMWWCTCKSLEIFFFTEVISACPSHITWLWFKSTLRFLTHCIYYLYSCHYQHQWQMATISTFPTPMPGMTKAGVDGQTGGLEMCLHLKPQVSSYFFILFFCSTIRLLMIFSYN